MILHNKYDKQTLRKFLESENQERKTLSFYRYLKIDSPAEYRDFLYNKLSNLKVLGRIYIAKEGVNGQISVPVEQQEDLRSFFENLPGFQKLRLNFAVEDKRDSFLKLKIKVREKIVADGLNDDTFDVTSKGMHLDAAAFNKITEEDNTVLIDMRNHYESEIGHFEDAICPDVDTFRDSLPIIVDMLKDKKDKNVVMYCTGGIRCEKATAWLKHNGFEKVYQLDGGIIEYARQVKESGLKNKFIGKNFVFDERLGERIGNEIISECHQCGAPCDSHTNCANDACHLLFIQCEQCAQKHTACCSNECSDFIQLPLEVQKEKRKGIMKGRQVFKKGRIRPKINSKD